MSNVSQSSVVAGRRIIVVILTALLLWAGGAVPSAQAAVGLRVDLKVLLIADGTSSDGISRATAWAALLDREGVPYTTVTIGGPGRPTITDEFLADADNGRGYFQAVVTPDQYATGLNAAEREALFRYERSYGVRQVNAYAFPDSNIGQSAPAFNGLLDGVVASVTSEGLAGPFTYLKGPVTIDDFDSTVNEVTGQIAHVLPALPTGATFTPLVNATADGQTGAIIGVYKHDFREQLSINAAYNKDQQWFNTVGHGILTWMTRGIHLGYQRNYLNVQIDDVFLPDSRWDSELNCTPGDAPTVCLESTVPDIRMIPSDVDRLVAWQNANNFTFDMVFNAEGSVYAIAQSETETDPLTDALLAPNVKDRFTWVNHTYTHTFLGCIQVAPVTENVQWHCATAEDEDGPFYDESLVPDHEDEDGGIRWLSEDRIFWEINENHEWAVDPLHNLPNYDRRALVTGEHSGLRTDPQQQDDNPFLAPALTRAGITYTASDASRVGEHDSRIITGGTTKTVPRYPMNIFYNAGTYVDEVDEYNWIYTSRDDEGSGICEDFSETTTCIDRLPSESDDDPVGSAETSFMNYIVPIEVRNAYGKVITNDPRPFYAHQSNLAESGILYPVVKGILERYRHAYDEVKSPIVTESLFNLGETLNDMAAWSAAQSTVTAYIDAGGVHISGPTGTRVPLTVPTGTTELAGALTGGGAEYGGELSGWLTASTAGALVAKPETPMGGYVGHDVPDAPALVIATPGPFYGSVALTWSAPADDGDSPITGYEIDQSRNTETPEWTTVRWPPADETSFVFGALEPGTEYIYRIRAVNAVGPGPYSTSAPAMALVEPHQAFPEVSAPDVPYGTDMSITLTVTTAEGDIPSGTATLTIAGTEYSNTLTGSTTTFSVPGLAVGTHNYTLDYGNDPRIVGFVWPGTVTVTKADVAVEGSVVKAPTPEQTGTYKVTVTQPAGTTPPTGDVDVTLTKGADTVPLTGELSGGAVTITVPALAAGTWTASIAYAGNTNYNAATGGGASVVSAEALEPVESTVKGTVTKQPTTTAAGSYKVTVDQASGRDKATGAVTVTLTKTGSAAVTISGTLAAGVATITVPKLAAGTWTTSIAYAGDANYLPKTVAGASVVSAAPPKPAEPVASTVVGTVTKKPTTTAAGSYKVAVTQASGRAKPTGAVTVTLKKGVTTKTISGKVVAGVVTIPVPKQAAGTWTTSIAYAGDANYAPKTVAGASVVVAKGAVSKVAAKVTKKPTTKKAGSYKITVTQPKGLAKATGKVTVTLKKGKVTKKVTGTLKSGAVTVAVPKLANGVWKASVAYAGNTTYAAKTSATAYVVVGKTKVSKVATKVTKKPTTKKAGTYKVTVTQAKWLPTPTGKVTVTLKKGKVTKTVKGTLKAGVVTVKVPKLAKGTWKVKVAYPGNANYVKKSANGKSVVVK